MCGDDVIKTKKVYSEVPEILSIKMATPHEEKRFRIDTPSWNRHRHEQADQGIGWYFIYKWNPVFVYKIQRHQLYHHSKIM